MKKIINKKILLILLWLLFLLPQIASAITMTMKVSPSSTTTSVGSVFSVQIMIDDYTTPNDISAGSFNLSFNPAQLKVTDSGGTEVTSLTANTNFPVDLENNVDNSSGIIKYTAGNLSSNQSAPVELVNIYFKTVGGGTATLDFSLAEILLGDFSTTLTPTTQGGTVTISGGSGADTTPPSSYCMQLSAYQKTNSFNVRWTGIDYPIPGASGIKQYQIQYKDNSNGVWTDWSTTSQTQLTFGSTSPLTVESGHSYYFRCRAQDVNGNWESYPLNEDTKTYIDLNDPTVDVSSPQAASLLSATVTVSPFVDDSESGISKVNLYVDSKLVSSSATSPYEFNLNTTTFSDGQHSITITAYDKAGRYASDTHTVNFDNTAPSSSITALTVGTSTESFNLNWSGTDNDVIASYDVQYKESSTGTWTDLLSATILTSTTFNGVNGTTYYFRCRAKDRAANQESYPTSPDYDTTTTIDLTAPYANITAPTNNQVISGTTAISVTANDNVAVSKVEIFIDDVLKTTLNSSPYNYSLDTTTLSDGSHTLKAVATDNESKTGTSSITVIVDNTKPSSMVSALTSTTTTAAFTVSWSGSDNVAVDSYDVQYKVESTGSWTDWLTNTTLTSANFGEANSPIAVQENATYYFQVRAKDTAANIESYPNNSGDTSTFISFSAPTISINNLSNNDWVSGTKSITTTTSNNTAKVDFIRDGQPQNAVTDSTSSDGFIFNWNTAVEVDGQHTLKAVATSTENKTSETNTITFKIDNTAPNTPTLNTLSATQTSTTFSLNWSVSDNSGGSGISGCDVEYKYKDDNGNSTSYTTLQSGITANTLSFSGKNFYTYYFRVKCKDVAGNVSNYSSETNTYINAYSVSLTQGDTASADEENLLITLSAGSSLSSTPIVSLTQNGSASVFATLVSQSGTTYNYKVALQKDFDGEAIVNINEDEATFKLNVGTIDPSNEKTFYSQDEKFSIAFSTGAVSSKKSFAIIEKSYTASGNFKQISKNYVVGTKSFTLLNSAKTSLTYNAGSLASGEETKLSAYVSNSPPEYLTSTVNTSATTVEATTTKLGTFALYVDNAAPTFGTISPTDGETITNRTPAITVNLTDEGSGIDTTNTTFSLDGEDIKFTFANNQLTYTPPAELSRGEHNISITTKDKVGNTTVFTSKFSIPEAELSLSKVYNLPNPATDKITFTYLLEKTTGVTITIEIFNTAGKLIKKIDGDLNGATTMDSSVLPNGIYLYKITAKDETKSIYKIGKIVILR